MRHRPMNTKKTQTMGNKSTYSSVVIFLMTFLLFASSNDLYAVGEKEEVITEIILINRQAELVEMDQDGEILRRHIAIPDYFTSGKSHRRNLRESLRKLRAVGHVEENHLLPGSSDLPGLCLQSFLNGLKAEMEHSQNKTICHIASFIPSEFLLNGNYQESHFLPVSALDYRHRKYSSSHRFTVKEVQEPPYWAATNPWLLQKKQRIIVPVRFRTDRFSYRS